MKRVFSGVQPSGEMTIGNYLGAFRHFPIFQDESDRALFCVVDLHAITVPQDPEKLRHYIYHVAAVFLATGVDPSRSILFAQSDVSEHTELAWILDCITNMGELNRMAQLKERRDLVLRDVGGVEGVRDLAVKSTGEYLDKVGSFPEHVKQRMIAGVVASIFLESDPVSVGLFNYPVLMAADILLYDTTHVPVGEDQRQHLELTRDLAERFNGRFGETFMVPKPAIAEVGARIMSLQDPSKKMSKSDPSEASYILLTDSDETIREKIKKAVTDSGTEIRSGDDKPALTNLLTIYSLCTGKSVQELEKEYAGQSYAEFKADLAEAVIATLGPIRERIEGYSHDELDRILREGAGKARALAAPKLREVKEKIGLWR